MINKLDKPFNELVFGLYGSRSSLLEDSIKSKGLSYKLLDELNEELLEDVDIFVETGVYSMIPANILSKPRICSLGFHETPLPEGKGWAPIRWTLENNKKHLVVSLYQLSEKLDDGGIVYQVNVPISKGDHYPVLETKRQKGIQECFSLFLDELQSGVLVIRPQTGEECFSDRRFKHSSELDATKTLKELWDEIRVCDLGRYPPYFVLDDIKVVLNYKVIKLGDI